MQNNSMMVFRLFLAYSLIVSGLIVPGSSAYAIRPSVEEFQKTAEKRAKERSPLSDDELEFLITFKSHITSLIHFQAAQVRSNLRCLGFEEEADTNLSAIEDEETKKQIKSQFQRYKESEVCKRFRDEIVPKIFESYSDMKVHLALHRGNPIDLGLSETVSKKSFGGTSGITGSQLDSYRAKCDLEKTEDKKTTCYKRIREMIESQANVTNCDKLKAPLKFDSSEFCFENLSVILDPTPKHRSERFSIPFLDDLISDKELPKLAKPSPLTWEELDTAVELFRNKYVSNSVDNKRKNNDLNKEEEDLYNIENHYNSSDRTHFARYFSAKDFQAQGWYVFSSFPEDSAPFVYANHIMKFPVLAFYRPEIELETGKFIDCESEEYSFYDFNEICRQYTRDLAFSGIAAGFVESHTYAALAKAYTKILQVSDILINSMEEKLNSEILKSENKGIRKISKDWLNLMSYKPALNNFLSQKMYTAFEDDQDRLVKELGRRNFKRAVFTIGGAIALGFVCSIFAPVTLGWSYVGCIGAFIAAPAYWFYQDTLTSYEENFMLFFANSGHQDPENNLTLIEYDTFKSEAQALLMETALFGVSFGGFEILKAMKRSIIKSARLKK